MGSPGLRSHCEPESEAGGGRVNFLFLLLSIYLVDFTQAYFHLKDTKL